MTLARELEDIETRRAAGTLTEADAALAKDALLRGAARTDAPAARDTPPGRSRDSVLIAGLFSNLMLTLVILGGLAAAAYVFIPLTLAMPIMIVLALCLPVIWLWNWVTDLF
jgi:hypothetical protein